MRVRHFLLHGLFAIALLTSCANYAKQKKPGKDGIESISHIAAAKPTPTEQQTKHDCGIASLEHAAKVWEVDISSSISPESRQSASNLASLAELAKRNGFEAYVLQGGSDGTNPYKEITGHLLQERPLILLLRIPPNVPDLISYVSAASRSSDFSGDAKLWARHFIVLTHALDVDEKGIAKKFTLMEPSAGKYRTVDLQWLDLFWRRQDAKYLLIGK